MTNDRPGIGLDNYQDDIKQFEKYWEGIDKFFELPREEQRLILGTLYCIIGAAGELGENLNKIKKVLRGDKPMQDALAEIRDEAGDGLWYIASLHNIWGWRVAETAWQNIQKLLGRKTRGTLQGSGDHR